MSNIEKVEQAIQDVLNSKPIIILDDIKREHEGDLFIPAQTANIDNINFIIKNARGLMCTPLTPDIATKLELKPMVENPTDELYTPFTFSVDAKGVKTGISAYERLETILKLGTEDAVFSDFTTPGHMFPLISHKDHVYGRQGHTEAAVAMCNLAGLYEVGVIMEILKDDGTMARTDDLIEMAKDWNLVMINISDIVEYANLRK